VPESPAASPEKSPLLTARSISWILYEVGYLAFAFVIFTRYLASWFITDLDNPDWYFSAAQFVVAAVLVFAMPLAGAVADYFGRRIPLLGFFSLSAAAIFALLGHLEVTPATNVLPILVLTGLGAVLIALAFAQFDPLLPTVAEEQHWGIISGLATGLGVLGAGFAVLIIGELFADTNKQGAFFPASFILVLATIPLLFVVRESNEAAETKEANTVSGSLSHAWHRLSQLPSTFRKHPRVGRLVAARFLYTDAIGTVNVYLIIYLDYLDRFTGTQVDKIAFVGAIFVGIGAAAAGLVIRRVGPRRPLMIVLPVWSAAIMLMAITGSTWSIFAAVVMGGIALGTVWTADRVFMLLLTPEALRGELFGVFALIGRVAQAIAPLILWGGLNLLLHDGTNFMSDLDAARVSLALLALTAITGALVLRPLSDKASEPVASDYDLKTV
jgi:UMF1 family MFS transporter